MRRGIGLLISTYKSRGSVLSRSLLSATHTHLLPLKRVARPLHTSCLRFSDAASSGGNQVEVINVQDENDLGHVEKAPE